LHVSPICIAWVRLVISSCDKVCREMLWSLEALGGWRGLTPSFRFRYYDNSLTFTTCSLKAVVFSGKAAPEQSLGRSRHNKPEIASGG
jgi:hypothetical protein